MQDTMYCVQDVNRLQADKEILEVKITELQAQNDTLKKELEDIKQIYGNYMVQMQTLINQKAIEAPNPKRQWWKFW